MDQQSLAIYIGLEFLLLQYFIWHAVNQIPFRKQIDSIKNILLQPYYSFMMIKMIAELIIEEKTKKSLTTISKHVTL